MALLRLRLLAATFVLLLSFVSHPSADQTYYACPKDCSSGLSYGVCEVSEMCDDALQLQHKGFLLSRWGRELTF